MLNDDSAYRLLSTLWLGLDFDFKEPDSIHGAFKIVKSGVGVNLFYPILEVFFSRFFVLMKRLNVRS